jgi:hypothetical protein
MLARSSMCADGIVCRSVSWRAVRSTRQRNPFYRLVTDGQPINVYASAWRVKYITVADLCLRLMQNSLMAVRDLKAAYHLVQYSGCRVDTRYLVRRTTNHAQSEYVARRTLQSGCGPGDCLGWCDKSLMALYVEGHVGQFAAARFEHKVINTGLAIVTDAAVVYASKELEPDSGAFVDDFLTSHYRARSPLMHRLSWGLPDMSSCIRRSAGTI